MRVLVTRPQPGADATARRLSALGHEPVVLPLTRTEPLDALIPGGPFDAVAFTSAAAARYFPASPAEALAGVPVLAVGEATERAARDAGFRDVSAAEGGAAALAQLAVRRLAIGARVLYAAGKVRTGGLDAALSAAGFAVDLVEVYDTVDVDAVAMPPAIDAAMVHSAKGAQALSRIAGNYDGHVLCISARAAEGLAPRLRARALIAARPEDAAMLAMLDRGG